MKSLLFATLTLLTCATQTFCAAFEDDTLLVQFTTKYSIANDGFAIAMYHEQVPADPYWYPEGPATGNQFGAALIPASPMVAATVHKSKELFNKKGNTAPYFKIDDTNPIDLSTNFFAMALCTYACDAMCGKRFLLLCPHSEHAETVKTIIERDTDEPSTLEDIFALTHKLLPTTTFFLFDAGVYCENRAMQPIDPKIVEMRAWREAFKALQKRIQEREPKPRARSVEMITRHAFTSERKSHIRTGSLDETKLKYFGKR